MCTQSQLTERKLWNRRLMIGTVVWMRWIVIVSSLRNPFWKHATAYKTTSFLSKHLRADEIPEWLALAVLLFFCIFSELFHVLRSCFFRCFPSRLLCQTHERSFTSCVHFNSAFYRHPRHHTEAENDWVSDNVEASRRSYRCWSRSITSLERRRKRRSCSEGAIWKTCCGRCSSTPFEWRHERRSSSSIQRKSREQKLCRGRRLIVERRNAVKGDKHQLKELSKKMKMCMWDRQRTKWQEKIQRILEEFRGIESRSCITSGRKRTLIPKVKNDKAETITSRKGIANVLGEFYSNLFAENQLAEEVTNLEPRMNTEKKSCNEDVRMKHQSSHTMKYKLPLITSKKGKASDNNGIRAEDIKTCDETTKQMIRQIFNEVLKQEDCTPESWRRTRIKVIYEKMKLPALYKLFKKIIYNRLCNRLDQAQSEDQGGLRRSCQTLDHLATHRLLEQKCREWGIKMWVATVDFMKAFDSLTHQSLWTALEKCGIESHCINLVKRLYAEQKGTVSTDKESEMFEIKRGSFVQFTLQHDAPNGTERWCGTLAETKRHGYTIGRLWIWLPHKPAFRWRRALVLCFTGAAPKNDVWPQAEFWECGIENPPRQDENSEQPKYKQKKRSGDQQHQSWDIICVWECEISWANKCSSETGNSRDQKSNQRGLGIVPQIQTRADIKIVLPATQTPLIQHGELRLWHLDTIKRTRKNDTINSTQSASLHRPNKEKKTQPSSRNEWDEEDEKTNHRSPDEETAEGSSSNTDYDQDSDISFMKDTDEEIDTGEIEEEDSVENAKRSTATAVEMKAAKIPCWIETHRRTKWRLASLPDERRAKKAKHGTLASAPSTRQTD